MAPRKPPKVETDDFLVAFGPSGTYLARVNAGNINRSNLRLSLDISTNLNAAKSINFIVFPTADALANSPAEPVDPYTSYSRKGHIGDSKVYTPSANYFPTLSDWLKDRWGTGGLQVVANGQGGWWALSSSGKTSNEHLPRDVRQLLKPYHPHGKVVHLAFGVEGAYIMLFEDGHVAWDLKGSYDALDAELETRAQGELVYASLSAYQAGRFFVAFKDASVFYMFPDSAEELDEDFLAAEALKVVVPSETAKHTDTPPRKKTGAGQFVVGVMQDVTAKTMEDAVGVGGN